MPVVASPAPRVKTAIRTLPATATTEERNRRISVAAAGPVSRAPAENAATERPNTVFDRPRSDLISGKRGSRLANSAPLDRNSPAVATRALRSRASSAGLPTFGDVTRGRDHAPYRTRRRPSKQDDSHDTAGPLAGRPRPPVRRGHRLPRLERSSCGRRGDHAGGGAGGAGSRRGHRRVPCRSPFRQRPPATGRARCRRRSSAAPTPRRRSGSTSPTATRRTCGSGSRTARSAPGCGRLDNFTPPFDLDGRLVGEATFVLPADLPLGYHQVHLSSGGHETSTPLIVTPAWLGLPRAARRAPRLGAGHPALQRPLRRTPGASAISPISPTWRCGPARATAPATCWSTRCTRPRRPRRWSRRPTCRRRGASPIRSTCGSRPSPSSPTCPSAAGCGSCAPTSRAGPASSTASTATPRGRPNAPR